MTTSKSKAKGTGGEREVAQLARDTGRTVRRTPPAADWDLEVDGNAPVVPVLVTRPDRGTWLATLDYDTFLTLVSSSQALAIEVKRYKKFAHHTIWEKLNGRVGRKELHRREQEIEEAINRGD